jgi:hypothetical protein
VERSQPSSLYIDPHPTIFQNTQAIQQAATIMRSALLLLSFVATSLAANCAVISTNNNGRKCKSSCNTDGTGTDYTNKRTNSLGSCVSACSADRKCAAASYHYSNGVCYLKTSVGTTKSASNIVSPFPPTSCGEWTIIVGAMRRSISLRLAGLHCVHWSIDNSPSVLW